MTSIFDRLSPGDGDLIIADESHRSIYSHSMAILDQLDAMHLVPCRPVHVARTGFQIEGLKHGELPEEVKLQLRQQDLNPDESSFEGTDLERKFSNTGTDDDQPAGASLARVESTHARLRDCSTASTEFLPKKRIHARACSKSVAATSRRIARSPRCRWRTRCGAADVA